MKPSSVWDPKGVVAVVDTGVLVSARIARLDRFSPSREIYRLAGVGYDSFTSPAILTEIELVLARPRFGWSPTDTRRWMDTFVRSSRQVDAASIPGEYASAVGRDQKDSPILKTALAVSLDADGQRAMDLANHDLGCFIVSRDMHFQVGRTVWGWEFIRPEPFLRLLRLHH